MENNRFGETKYRNYGILEMFSEELDTWVYAINVDQILDEPELFRNKISRERYEKMLRYHNRLDKMLLVGNEILFEYGISRYFPEVAFSEWKRHVDAAGKPYVEGPRQLYFNMSHAGTYSVCAFSKNPVGVDIEKIRPVDLSIAERHYCHSEYEEIMRHQGNEQIKRFYQYWVLKESFTKAVGLGLSIPLNVFSFDTGEDDGVLYVEHSINRGKYLSQQFPFRDIRYEMALCIQGA
ncbi:MAG: 4'-phosphopantetheinyl transferase superfamily protein [Hungatella sp.]|nr:4'-phosphopantetheinyl transferase superfamily protein [Hungatella sp.]